jgi:hypothetical protein
VVTLPSRYTGGELIVEHNEERKAYRGSKTALSLVAFYADCRHEVLEWMGQEIGTALASPTPSYRDKELTDLGKPLASVLTAAAAIGAGTTRETVSGHIRQQGDAVTALEMSALRAAELPRNGTPADAGFRTRSRMVDDDNDARFPDDWLRSISCPP